ncbi:DUF6247 family protein [Actinosynnema sp. CA-248983]
MATCPEAFEPDLVAIRACLTPTLVAEFDREWDLALDQAEVSAMRDLLGKWRHIAHTELRAPGSYFRMLAKAEQIQRLGANPDAVSIEDVKALLRERRAG